MNSDGSRSNSRTDRKASGQTRRTRPGRKGKNPSGKNGSGRELPETLGTAIPPSQQGKKTRRSSARKRSENTRAMAVTSDRPAPKRKKKKKGFFANAWEIVPNGWQQIRYEKWSGIDAEFLFYLILLVCVGLLMVFSASMYTSISEGSAGYSSFLRQLIYALLGFAVLYIVSRVDFREFNNLGLQIIMMVFVALLLVYVKFMGVDVNGARRWISIPGGTFQPSELAKVVLIMYCATMACKVPETLRSFWLFFAFYCIPIALICGLTAIEPSLSAAMAIGVGALACLWFAMTPIRYFGILAGLVIGAGAAFIAFEPWRLARFNVFTGDTRLSYQIRQSLVAFGSGGIFGVGIGNGKQKLLFLPELQNDFIFANIGEELGLVGCLAVLLVYSLFIYRGFRIGFAIRKKSNFGFLYACSVMTLLGFQVFVNIAVAINAMPVTGMALPFISYGGTSMIVLFLMVAPIMNMSRQVELGPTIRLRLPTVAQKKNRKKPSVGAEGGKA